MWIPIPWTSGLVINDDLEVRATNIHTPYVVYERGDKKLLRANFGAKFKSEEHDREWILLLSKIAGESYPDWSVLKKMTFTDVSECKFPTPYGYEPSFTNIRHPEAINGFRIYPRAVRYAVSADGRVYDTLKKRIVKPYGFNGEGNVRYPSVKIVIGGVRKDVGVHIMVAWTWLKRVDVRRYRIVNHLDGNKRNPAKSNLELTTNRGNSEHARDKGLLSHVKPCSLKDMHTGKVTHYKSMSDCVRKVGFLRGALVQWLSGNTKRPFLMKYDFKFRGDKWHKPILNISEKTKYIIDVDGVQYIRIEDMCTALKIPYRVGVTAEACIDRLTKMGYNVKVIHSSYRKDGYEVISTVTRHTRRASSISLASKMIGMNQHTLKDLLSKVESATTNGWAIRRYTEAPWPTFFKESNRGDKVVVCHNVISGATSYFDCIAHAVKSTGLSKAAIVGNLNTGKPNMHGWLLHILMLYQQPGSDQYNRHLSF